MQISKRILFVTIPEKGHINPMIGVAQQLFRKRYELAFFAKVDISKQLKKAGLDIPAFYDTTDKNEEENFLTKGKDFAEKLQDKHWLRNWIKTLLIDAVQNQIPVLENIVATFKPSLIVTDPMVYAAAIVAEKTKLPWVGISSSLNPITPTDWVCDLTETLNLYSCEREQLFNDCPVKAKFRVSDLISPWLNIVFSTEEYIPRAWSKNDFSFYVGRSYTEDKRGDEQDFPFHLLKKECKKVYMSLGSQVYYHPELFDSVQKALQRLDIQLIFSVNELINTSFVESLHENVIAVSYAPQLKLLPHIDLMISHGGANSVMECLAHGKPIALLPICNDQFLQAKFVLANKVGQILDVENPQISAYKNQLEALLEPNAEERKNAERIGASFQGHKGPEEAAVLIEKLLRERKPMLPEFNRTY